MLCCSFVALLALCEALFLAMKKGTVHGKTNQGEQKGKTKRKGSQTGVEFLGLSRREISVKFFGAINHRPQFVTQVWHKIPRPGKMFFFFSRRVSSQISRLFWHSWFSSPLAQRF